VTGRKPTVVFILPSVGRAPGVSYVRSWQMEPLAIAQLASLTPSSYQVVFMDDRVESIDYGVKADLVALSVETYTARRAAQIAARFRARRIPVVMGGFHPTLAPDDAANHADAIVVGEAEGVWPAVLADAAAGRLKLRYQAAKRPSLAGLRPDRSIFAGKPYMNLALVETARGCPHRCEFCSISSFFGASLNVRPVEDVVDEVRGLGRRSVFFVDDNLGADPDRFARLLEALIPLRIRWAGQVTVTVARDAALLALMRRSGCAGVLVGLESLEGRALDAMGKPVRRGGSEEYGEAVRRFHAHGLGIYATFVFGYDGDRRDTFERTLRFARGNKLFFTAFNHLVPFPGTPLYRRLAAENRLRFDRWWMHPDYRFGEIAFRPAPMEAGEMEKTCYEYRRRFYSFGSILHRATNIRANCPTPGKTALFLAQNLGAWRDVDRRQGLPLGMPGEAP
jgi:radical SAM superfamily enzyme YgiQ (UPF0313 family)